jgi:hypothetical protein
MRLRPRNSRKYVKSRWRFLAKTELKTVILSIAVQERNKPIQTRVRHRRARLEAVALYRERFGDEKFLKNYSGQKLPLPQNLWLPRGYAYWKVRYENFKSA